MRIVLLSVLILCTSLLNAQKDAGGIWHSSFIVMGQPTLLDLEVNFYTNEISMRAPDQSMLNMICTDVILDDNLVHFAWKPGNLEFQGFYFPAGDSIQGMMKQNGLEWAVSFFREEQKKKEINRPQTPKPPFDYPIEEVSFQNKYDKTTIYGTLTLPKNPSNTNFPVVVLASGSGPQDRNCSILGHQSFWVIADYLAKQGIATLRFDDRGTGKSTAKYADASLTNFGQDVASCVLYLKGRKDMKGHPIGLMGHSEGGMHLLIAQKLLKNKVSFMAFLSCIGGTGEQTLVKQQYDIPIKNGSTQEAAQWNSDLFKGVSELVKKYPDIKQCTDSLSPFLYKMYHSAPKGAIDGQTEQDFIVNTSVFLNNPWGHEFVSFNAQTYLKNLKKMPVLALFGGSDLQVEPVSNYMAFDQALSEKEKKISTLEIIPGLNHLMQECSICNVMEYGELTQTISPVILEKVAQFILHL